LLLAIFGSVIGWFWARTTKVYLENNEVKSRNSTWYLVVWGGVFAVNQLIIIITNRPPGIAMALLILSTFIVWGTTGNIIKRYLTLCPATVLQPAGAGAYIDDPQAAQLVYHDTAQSGRTTTSFSPQVKSAVPTPPAASPFEEMQARYSSLRNDLDQGAISREKFRQIINELRFQDATGTWWQLSEDGQSWLKWDGSQWVVV